MKNPPPPPGVRPPAPPGPPAKGTKTIKSLINEAETKWDRWLDISRDPVALRDIGKTAEEARNLASFFEGQFDGLCRARDRLG